MSMCKKRLARILSMTATAALAATVITACGSSGGASDTADTADADVSAAEEQTSEDQSASGSASANAEYTLTVQSQDPEAGATGQFLEAWAAAVEEASGGRLEINVYHGATLGAGTESYNMVTSGAVDIAWGLPSMTTGKFPLTDVAALPFTAEDTLQASYALWDLYETTDYLDDEWGEVKVILLHTNCDSPLLLKNSKVESVADLKGRSCRFIGGVCTNFAEQTGAIPSSIAISDVYTNLEKGVIDSAANCGWDAVSSFNLYEQADYILDWHMNVNPYYLVMNLDSYNSLPEDLQAVIDAYSGFKALEYVGTKWQDVKASCMESVSDKIYEMSDEEMAEVETIADDVISGWIEEISATGADGQGLYDAYMERLETYTDKIAQ